jgi:hypothetical protein
MSMTALLGIGVAMICVLLLASVLLRVFGQLVFCIASSPCPALAASDTGDLKAGQPTGSTDGD